MLGKSKEAKTRTASSNGKLTSWDDDKGYGFISPADGGSEVFVHISAFPNSRRRPAVDDRVTFVASRDQRNRLHAQTAELTGTAKAAAKGPRELLLCTTVVAVFFGALATYVDYNKMPLVMVIWYGVLSCLLFVMYGWDKRAAKRDRRRISEVKLHVGELIGGWPGALLAQQVFRHKTRKLKYQIIFWAVVVINCAALFWWFIAGGAEQFEQIVGVF